MFESNKLLKRSNKSVSCNRSIKVFKNNQTYGSLSQIFEYGILLSEVMMPNNWIYNILCHSENSARRGRTEI
jgi:hypothetical protein